MPTAKLSAGMGLYIRPNTAGRAGFETRLPLDKEGVKKRADVLVLQTADRSIPRELVSKKRKTGLVVSRPGSWTNLQIDAEVLD